MTIATMVKSKRDLLNTPRRRASLTKARTIARTLSRPVSSATAPSAANIKVVVRVRPPNENELCENFRSVVKIVDDQMLIFDPKEEFQPFFYHGVPQRGRDLLKKANKDLNFMFDRVFNNNSTNHEVFVDSTLSLINTLMDGYNCSVFAYGATGAGKTFTMIGNIESPGITCLTMRELFKKMEELNNERDFELGITYLEVYNELVKDLLNPGPPLQLREDSKYGVMIAGIKVYKIVSHEELFVLLERGNKNRTQHPTDANAESSRSHAVFQVYIQMTTKITGEVRTAKLSMIDLAGSERGSATGYVGARFTEGANINKSLLALGNCINSLADGLRHVPYRDSKLTRLLKDSLGGNCQTIMIANVSPSSASYEDTYNTLKYATRAKKIKSNMKRNIVNVEMHVGNYVKLVEDLQQENVALKSQNESLQAKLNSVSSNNENHVDPELLARLKEMMEEKKDIVERHFQINIMEVGINLRKQLKQETESRLSDLYSNTPDKNNAHRKINNVVDRFQKKETALKDEMAVSEKAKEDIDITINELVNQYPQLKSAFELENLKLMTVEYQNKAELEKKQNELLLDDHREKCSLLEKMAALLKPCYLSIKGHGFATSTLIKQYEDLVLDFHGRKNVKWGNIPDSGVSSSSTSLNDEETRTALKRKVDDGPPSTECLDSTFTLPVTPNKPKVKINTQQLMAKASNVTPRKRLINGISPRNKENRPYMVRRPPLGRIDTAKTVVANKCPVKGATASRSLADRPPFRR